MFNNSKSKLYHIDKKKSVSFKDKVQLFLLIIK